MTGRAPLRLTRRHLEALSAFARAYLHEDAVAEYGGAIGAAKAFAADATDEDRHRVSAALDALAAATHGHSIEALHRFLSRQIRCAWPPERVEELTSLARVIRG